MMDRMPTAAAEVQAGDRAVRVSSPDRVIYPETYRTLIDSVSGEDLALVKLEEPQAAKDVPRL